MATAHSIDREKNEKKTGRCTNALCRTFQTLSSASISIAAATIEYTQ